MRSPRARLLAALLAFPAAATAQQATIWSDDLESGAPGFIHGMAATQDDWQLGTPSGVTPHDPAAAHSGTKAFGNDLGPSGWDGLYKNLVQNWLEAPAVDCSRHRNVKLTFWRFLTVERAAYDQASVFVNGHLVWRNASGADHRDGAWTPVTIDISAYADGQPEVRVRFELASDDSVTFGGWTIDDLALVGDAADVTPPSVVKSYPVNRQTDIPLDATIAVTFSEPVDRASAEAGFKFAGGVASSAPPGLRPSPTGSGLEFGPVNGTFAWDDTTLRFDPAADLTAGTFYSFSVSNVRDLQGNVMTEGYVVDFWTVAGGADETLHEEHFDGITTWTHGAKFGTDDWHIGAPRASTFDPGMAPTSPRIAGNTLGGNYPASSHNWIASPDIDATEFDRLTLSFKRWLTVEKGRYDQAVVSVNGVAVWTNGADTDHVDTAWTTQTIDITTAAARQHVVVKFELVTDGGVQKGGWNVDDVVVTGHRIADAVAPTIVATDPVHGATGVPVGAPIQVTFSEPMATATVEQCFASMSPYTPGSVSWNGTTATFTAASGLFPSTLYRLALWNAQDLAGNSLAGQGEIELTTAALDGTPPVIAATTPGSGGTITPYGSITLTFSEPMNDARTDPAVVVRPYLNVHKSWNGNTLTIEPLTPWIAGTAYTVTVRRAAQGMDANYLATDFVLPFSVSAAGGTPQPVRLLFETFEGTAAGWTHGYTATQDDWQLGTPRRTSTYDPGAAWSGTRVYGNDLGGSGWNGTYGNGVANWLSSPAIDTTGHRNVTLVFRRWLTVQSSPYDQARVKVNGTTVWTNPSTGSLIDTSWKAITLNIGAWADDRASVQLQFTLNTNASTVYGGWNVDDVEVWGTPITTAPADTDGDGLEDAWETFFFGSLAPLAGADPDGDGLTNLVEHGLRTSPTLADSDADGLLDGWEKNGRGSANLPAYGASPLKKDIFVEVDWMQTWKPTAASIQRLVDSLAAEEIALHVDTGNLGGGQQVTYLPELPFSAGPDQFDLYTFKYGEDLDGDGQLDTALSEPADQRDYNRDGDMLDLVNEDVNSDGVLEPRRFAADRLGVFHYVVYCNVIAGTGYSGLANFNDDDFIIGWNNSSQDEVAVAGLLLHELGHNLNLGTTPETHDRGAASYESCMNYRYISTLPDYSDGRNQIGDAPDWGLMRPQSIAEWALVEDGRTPPSFAPLLHLHGHRHDMVP